jgi:cytochrome P450 family 1 subfamily A polypeptide 1
VLAKKYAEHVATFDGQSIRDLTDAMLMAKKEAEEENSLDSMKYLTSQNIMNSIQDLFTAGSETSRSTLLWAFLFMSRDMDCQRRLRREVEENIPVHEVPTLEHRKKCHFTAAFIAETLRIRHIVPNNIPHKTLVDVTLGGHVIPGGLTIFPSLISGLMSPELWGDPEVFRPERFLDGNDKFISKPNAYYNPFSHGRRSCPGARVALADMFMIVARVLQQTKGYEFVLPPDDLVDMKGDTRQTSGWFPVKYSLLLKPVEEKNNNINIS